MTLQETMSALESLGSAQTKKTWAHHGAKEPMFGVKVGDMKILIKQIKKDHDLSLQLFETKNADAMYFAGLISDPSKLSKAHIQQWAEQANWYMISEYTVPWVAADSPYALELARKWIDDARENVASSGWSTWSSVLVTHDNEVLSQTELSQLIDRIKIEIVKAPNRVRYTMNGCLIAIGTYYPLLKDKVVEVATAIGKVQVEMGGTACKVPDAVAYIDKVINSGRILKKKKTAKC